MLSDHNLIFIFLIILIVAVCKFCWTIAMYFCRSVSQVKTNFYFDGLPSEMTHISVCICYDARFTQNKW